MSTISSRESCHQDSRQDKARPEDAAASVPRDNFHGETSPSKCYTPVRGGRDASQAAYNHGVRWRRGTLHEDQ